MNDLGSCDTCGSFNCVGHYAAEQRATEHAVNELEAAPMKDGELGQYVCVAQGGCLHVPHRTIRADGVWVRSSDPLNPGSHLYSSAHRDCYESWAETLCQ